MEEKSDKLEFLTKITEHILSSPIDLVYFIRCNDYVKIGTTKGGLVRRIADLQVGNPYELQLEWFVLGDHNKEREIHRKLLKYWTRGEWHKIPKDDLFKLLKTI